MPPSSKVLIIDDTPSVSPRLKRWLKRRNVVCSFVESAEEAGELLKHDRYDMVMFGHEVMLDSKLNPLW